MADWSYEIALRGAPDDAARLADWFAGGPQQALAGAAGLASLDLYTPAQGDSRDPYNDDGAGPLMMIMATFATRAALDAVVGDGTLARAVGPLPAGITGTGAAFERRLYPVGDGTAPAPLTAPFSYVVRYHRPAEDEAAFVRNYLDSHPVTQAHLPGIRAIACYLPAERLSDHGRPAADQGLSWPDYMIGNEVAFDDVAAFNAAMASPVRQELREHYHAFPAFSGAVTHYPMARRRLAG